MTDIVIMIETDIDIGIMIEMDIDIMIETVEENVEMIDLVVMIEGPDLKVTDVELMLQLKMEPQKMKPNLNMKIKDTKMKMFL